MKFFSDPQKLLDETSLIDRFLTYVRIDTRSDPDNDASPSTEIQFDLASKLVEELESLGITDAAVDESCYVTATLRGDERVPKVGLLAHLDTSPAVSGTGVMPLLHRQYDGRPIVLRDEVTITVEDNPELEKYIGDTIITSDGTTLLGADDKAGIAVIMSALEYLSRHPEVPHPTIRVCFTPDEEIGRGTAEFPLETFGAEVAYTVDGSFAGEVNVETFEAFSADLTFRGVSTHPGTAKGKLVNALKHMAKFLERLPQALSPEETDGRQGFIHPVDCRGDASECRCQLILRDFEEDGIEGLKQQVKQIAESVAEEEPRLEIEVAFTHTYPNMYRYLSSLPEIQERLEQAVRGAGLTPVVVPIRGGTDGSQLTRLGLPCPNLFDGGMNFHDKREWVAATAMGLSLCTVLNLMMLHTQ
jgi:tripeptide aminopeptidase